MTDPKATIYLVLAKLSEEDRSIVLAHIRTIEHAAYNKGRRDGHDESRNQSRGQDMGG